MTRGRRVHYELDSNGIKKLPDEEIKIILRAADGLISTGGRSMLAKILKGSKDKKILEHGLDNCPCYGFYKELKIDEIMNKVDWMIEQDYLRLEYFGRLPMLVFSEYGWKIERETYAEELFEKIKSLLDERDYTFAEELKGRNRGMILLLLDKIKQSNNARFIPFLNVWIEIDSKKVKIEIEKVIDHLKKYGEIF